MGNIIMISTGGKKENVENVNSTLLHSVSIQQYFDEGVITESEKNILFSIFPNGVFNCWGIKEGNTKKNKNLFDKIEIGDIFIGCKEGIVEMKGRVSYKMTYQNERLGNRLWPNEGAAYKWIWFVSDLHFINCNFNELKNIVGIGQGYTLRGTYLKEITNDEEINNFLNGI